MAFQEIKVLQTHRFDARSSMFCFQDRKTWESHALSLESAHWTRRISLCQSCASVRNVLRSCVYTPGFAVDEIVEKERKSIITSIYHLEIEFNSSYWKIRVLKSKKNGKMMDHLKKFVTLSPQRCLGWTRINSNNLNHATSTYPKMTNRETANEKAINYLIKGSLVFDSSSAHHFPNITTQHTSLFRKMKYIWIKMKIIRVAGVSASRTLWQWVSFSSSKYCPNSRPE